MPSQIRSRREGRIPNKGKIDQQHQLVIIKKREMTRSLNFNRGCTSKEDEETARVEANLLSQEKRVGFSVGGAE